MAWLFGADRENVAATSNQRLVAHLPGPGRFAIGVVGESHYREAFEALCGRRCEEGVMREVEATLVHEDDNRHDPRAVRVQVDGLTVGYLSRGDARAYRLKLAEAGHAGIVARCAAQIRGGWDDGDGDSGEFGIFLDLPVDD